MKKTIPQSKFWIYLAVTFLSFNGGFINAATIVGFLHYSVSYMTGNIAYFGADILARHFILALRIFGLFFAFLLGAFISGMIVRADQHARDNRYRVNLSLQMALVIFAMLVLGVMHSAGEYVLALVMGLQNAMTTHYGAALIRTTHMTGTTTDLGIEIAKWLKGYRKQAWKIKIYALLLLLFFAGVIVGGFAFLMLGHYALIISVAIYGIMILMHHR